MICSRCGTRWRREAWDSLHWLNTSQPIWDQWKTTVDFQVSVKEVKSFICFTGSLTCTNPRPLTPNNCFSQQKHCMHCTVVFVRSGPLIVRFGRGNRGFVVHYRQHAKLSFFQLWWNLDKLRAFLWTRRVCMCTHVFLCVSMHVSVNH